MAAAGGFWGADPPGVQIFVLDGRVDERIEDCGDLGPRNAKHALDPVFQTVTREYVHGMLDYLVARDFLPAPQG